MRQGPVTGASSLHARGESFQTSSPLPATNLKVGRELVVQKAQLLDISVHAELFMTVEVSALLKYKVKVQIESISKHSRGNLAEGAKKLAD